MRVIITPQRASELLERNAKNRPLDKKHIARLAKTIEEGKWVWNGQTITVDENGDVLDGQHRLYACIKANLPIDTEFLEGVPRNTFMTVDHVKRRTAADLMAMMQIPWWVEKTGLARHLFYYRIYDYHVKKIANALYEPQDIVEFYLKNREEIDFTVDHMKMYKKSRIVVCFSKLLFIDCLCGKIDKEQTKAFIDKIVYGYDLEKGSPILALRQTIINENTYIFYRTSNVIILDLLFRCWNLYRQNESVELNSLKLNYKAERLPKLI